MASWWETDQGLANGPPQTVRGLLSSLCKGLAREDDSHLMRPGFEASRLHLRRQLELGD